MLISSNSTMYHLYHQKTPEEVEAEQALQESVKAAAKPVQSETNSTTDTVSFLSNAMEELIANKIGVDKEKLDELKKEIEALENLKNPTQEQKERLVMLTEKMEKMVQEATERTAEQEASRVPDNKIQTYRAIDAMTSPL
jgi:predicted  nucleic acid-binding Zn-ribbon protein